MTGTSSDLSLSPTPDVGASSGQNVGDTASSVLLGSHAPKKLLVAGGGTGGHLFPGLAVADVWCAGRPEAQALFVGTRRGIEAKKVPEAGYDLAFLEVTGLKRMGLIKKVQGLLRLPSAFFQSVSILRRFRPDVVLGVGGYASGPVVMTAALLGIPTAIQEQNSVPGITNRILARFARVVFTAFPIQANRFPTKKIRALGNPVRAAIREALAEAPHVASSPLENTTDATPDDAPQVLVLGGSQGARAVNQLVLKAMAAEVNFPPVVLQCGARDEARVREDLRRLGLGNRVTLKPFIDDMAEAYRAAALVIARAGALTLAELALAGKPCLLVPLPTAADDHQTTNARSFETAGAGEVVPQSTTTSEALAARVLALVEDPAALRKMGAAALSLGKPNATVDITRELAALAD